MSLQAPNKISTVQAVMLAHPEIDTMDENERGKIIDLVCKEENTPGTNRPWGRKARNSDGSNKNTDGLTYLRTDNKFEVYDVISGVNGSATWDLGTTPTNPSGIFAQGENGYWAPADPVGDVDPIPPVEPPIEPPVEPLPPVQVPVYTPRVPYETGSQFVEDMNNALEGTKLALEQPNCRALDMFPIQTTYHLLYRYFFEHDTYSDQMLIDEAVARANGTWVD